MKTRVIREKQDLTYLNWSHIRSSSGTAGTFLKSESSLYDKKIYYKLSNFDPVNGIVGHECVKECGRRAGNSPKNTASCR